MRARAMALARQQHVAPSASDRSPSTEVCSRNPGHGVQLRFARFAARANLHQRAERAVLAGSGAQDDRWRRAERRRGRRRRGDRRSERRGGEAAVRIAAVATNHVAVDVLLTALDSEVAAALQTAVACTSAVMSVRLRRWGVPVVHCLRPRSNALSFSVFSPRSAAYMGLQRAHGEAARASQS